LGLILGGAILGIVGPDLTKFLPSTVWSTFGLTVLSLGLILYGFAIPQSVFRTVVRGVRTWQWRTPRIGILGGLASTAGDGIGAVNTDIPAIEWLEEIRKASVRRGVSVNVKLIPALTSFDSFDAVINPFGATYPEASFQDFPVYTRLLEYVREGGLFINAADIPTYFAFNANLNRSIDRTPAAYDISGRPVRFFSRVPLMEELAVRVINCQNVGAVSVAILSQFASCGSPPASLVITRAAIVEGNVKSVLAPLTIGRYTATPLFFCPYGDGQVLCSLSWLSGQYASNNSLVPFLADVIIHAITSGRN